MSEQRNDVEALEGVRLYTASKVFGQKQLKHVNLACYKIT